MSDAERLKLTEDQIEHLYRIRQIENDGGNPEVYDGETVDALCEILASALRSRGLENPDQLSPEGLAAQFRSKEAKAEAVEQLLGNQHPETGGADEDEIEDDPEDEDPEENLSSDECHEVVDKLERAARMADRTPEFSETLRQEAAEICNVESADDIDVEALRGHSPR